MSPEQQKTTANPNVRTTSTRRHFLAAAMSSGALAGTAHGQASESAISFPHSYLYCVPKKSGIWVRIQAECHARLVKLSSGLSQEFVLGTVAKTGVTPLTEGEGHAPGYDYSVIFSNAHVYTKRSHASSFFNNPSTHTIDEFGEASWKLTTRSARLLGTAEEIRGALQNGQLLTARSTFPSDEGEWNWVVEYPVKWADCAVDGSAYRVETGPVLLLNPTYQAAAAPPPFDAFQWAHLDYHDGEEVRCLIESPTSITVDGKYTPARTRAGLTGEQMENFSAHLARGLDALPASRMQALLQTDHYARAEVRRARHEIFALEEGQPK